MAFNAAHLIPFKASVEAKLDVNKWDTKHARDFARDALGQEPSTLLANKQNRASLKALAENSEIDTLTLCLAVLAWGGMHRGNRDRLFEGEDHAWVQIAEDMRSGKLNRFAAYEAFKFERAKNRLKGMGPAFYTKLIHFLLPRLDDGEPQAYIMDQWAGCSINLLAGEPIVLMNSSFTYHRTRDGLNHSSNFIASNANTGEDYERFCALVEKLATHFGVGGDEIDRALMSDGGKNRLPWRAYVMKHRTP